MAEVDTVGTRICYSIKGTIVGMAGHGKKMTFVRGTHLGQSYLMHYSFLPAATALDTLQQYTP